MSKYTYGTYANAEWQRQQARHREEYENNRYKKYDNNNDNTLTCPSLTDITNFVNAIVCVIMFSFVVLNLLRFL